MTWQWVVIIVAAMGLCCFYNWCHTTLLVSSNQRAMMESQAAIAQSNVEYARLQSSNATLTTTNN